MSRLIDVSFKLDAAEEKALIKKLSTLATPREHEKAIKPELQAGARRIKQLAKQLIKAGVSRRTGALLRSIAMGSYRTRNKRTTFWAAVGIKDIVATYRHTKGKRTYKARPVKYAHLIEGGFTHKRSGKRFQGVNFIRRSFAEVHPIVARKIIAHWRSMINAH